MLHIREADMSHVPEYSAVNRCFVIYEYSGFGLQIALAAYLKEGLFLDTSVIVSKWSTVYIDTSDYFRFIEAEGI